MHEAHEFCHMAMGRLFCGEWGVRDFNVVAPVVAACVADKNLLLLVGIAGPLFNYIVIWIGFFLVRFSKNKVQLSWGFAFIFSSLPVARIITAVFGGGDEVLFFRSLTNDPFIARVLGSLLILIFMIYPLVTAFRRLKGYKYRILIFLTLLFAPMFLEGILVLYLLNQLLKFPALGEIWIMGSPFLVIIVLAVDVVLFWFMAKNIGTFFKR